MPQRVNWKKGMRLSTEVFFANDNTKYQWLRQAALLASASRMGLYTTKQPFALSINITNNTLEVVTLSCHGITRAGNIIDIEFNSGYSSTFDTRVMIPASANDEAYILILKYHEGAWREVDEMYSEAKYTFELVGENTIIDDHSLPIGRIVNQFGWRLDETDFCPPCLYVTSHIMHNEQLSRTISILRVISDKCMSASGCVATTFMSIFWPAASSTCLNIECEKDTLTPAKLMASIQQVINAFIIGCNLDKYINLSDYTPFITYMQNVYDAKRAYPDIQQGISLLSEIDIKVNAICAVVEPEPAEKPKSQPKAQPAPEQRSSKRRWEGIEI